jgi:hypothetical protein
MRAYLLASAILLFLGYVCFAIAQDQAFRGPDCAQYLHPDCATFARNSTADLVVGDRRYGGYPTPPAIDDPNDPDSPDDN